MLRVLAAVLVFASVVSAQIVAPQPIRFTGVVEPVLDPGALGILCEPPNYQLACADGTFFLTSSTLDLSAYLGVNARFTATNVTGCPLWDVSAAEVPPPTSLQICGTPEGLGCPVRLRSSPGGISQHALFLSLSPGLQPVNLNVGSLLLGEPLLLVATVAGAMPVEGAAFDFTIPGDPDLIGISFYWQAASRQVGPIVGPLQLGNAICFTPIGFTIFCAQPTC